MTLEFLLEKLDQTISQGKEPREAVAEAIVSCKPSELVPLARRLSRVPALRILAIGEPLPKTFAGIQDIGAVHQSLSDERAFSWCAAVLRLHSKEIDSFVELERRFDEATFRAAWPEAVSLLDEIERCLGVSYWTLGQRLVLLERTAGINSQKAYAQAIRDDPNISVNVKAFSSLLSMLAESALSADSFYDYIKANFGSEDPFIIEYVTFRCAFFGPFQFSMLDDLVSAERLTSIIDRYLALVRVGQLIYSDKTSSRFKKSYRRALEVLGSVIRDSRLTWLRAVFEVSADELRDEFREEHAVAFDLYTTGSYRKAFELADKIAQAQNAHAELLDLQVKAYARLSMAGQETPGDAIVTQAPTFAALLSLVVGDRPVGSAIVALKKDICAFSQSRRAALLHATLSRLTSPLTHKLPAKYERFADTCGLVSNPRSLFFVSKSSKFAKDLARALLKTSPTYALFASGSEQKLTGALAEALKRIPPGRAAKYVGTQLFELSRYQDAHEKFRKLSETGDELDRVDASEGMAAALVRLRQLPAASDVICGSVLTAVESHRRLPIDELCDALEESQMELPVSQMPIEIPNVFGMYSVYRRKGREYRMGTICDDFLSSWNVSRPSELRRYSHLFRREQLNFFLATVCVPASLETNPHYNSSKEIEDERVFVLQWLIELDEGGRANYAAEIAEITRQQEIRTAMRSVERSKITVNIPGVLSVLPKETEESFTRFKSLPRFSVSELRQLIQEVSNLSREGSRSSINKPVVFVVPKTERIRALERLYDLIRQQFVFSNDFGLDAYLSVGIRHSTLPGQLRACFERHNLVTGKTSEGEYATNAHWLGIVQSQGAGDERAQLLDSALRKFSSEIDAAIAHLRDSQIQIRTDSKPNGLLVIQLLSGETEALEKELLSCASVEQAVRRVLDLLWKQTDTALANVRSELKGPFRERLEKSLDELINDARSAGIRMPSLDAAITSARTALQHEIGIVAEWFTRGDQASVDDFKCALAADIALTMVNRCYATRSLSLDPTGNRDERLKAWSLIGLVNMLFIMFDNAMKHSPAVDGIVSAKLETSASRPTLSFTTRNSLDPSKSLDEIGGALESIRADITAQSTPERVRAEGGSGLVKISRIGKIDLSAETTLTFDIDVDREFVTTVRLKQDRLWA